MIGVPPTADYVGGATVIFLVISESLLVYSWVIPAQHVLATVELIR